MVLGLALFVFTEQSNAQIMSRSDRPLRKDTLMHQHKHVARADTDTVWRRRTDAERRQDSIKWRKRADSLAAVVKRKTSETSAKVGAAMKDCSLKNVKGPKGETVYVDENDRRYYINKDGNKVFMKRPSVKQ